jgi:hypothetical protein
VSDSRGRFILTEQDNSAPTAFIGRLSVCIGGREGGGNVHIHLVLGLGGHLHVLHLHFKWFTHLHLANCLYFCMQVYKYKQNIPFLLF